MRGHNWLGPAIALALLLAADQLLPRVLNPYYLTIATRIGVAVLAAVSLQLVNGFTGQFSIGHAAFMALGGYMAAWISYYLSLAVWKDNYCRGSYERCQRYKRLQRGEQVPRNLMPNGKIISTLPE